MIHVSFSPLTDFMQEKNNEMYKLFISIGFSIYRIHCDTCRRGTSLGMQTIGSTFAACSTKHIDVFQYKTFQFNGNLKISFEPFEVELS